MTTSLTINLFEQINPLRLAGPLFDKELRVSSRQRRLYALRFAYICLLMVVTVYLWLVVVRAHSAGSAIVQVSRMAEAGKFVVMTIVWFQFVAAQLLAAVLLSDAIGGEIRQRTLDVLLVTPITSVQIVLGKLFSKLLQLVLLLAASLPLLAIVRVFGGVPWDYVLLGLCVTLTTAVFVGALSLFLSIRGGQFQRVVTSALAWCLLLWGGGGAILLSLSQAGYLSRAHVQDVLHLTNPFVVMMVYTQAMLAGSAMGGALLAWLLHCAVALGATVVLLLLAVWRVRRITITSIVAQAEGRRKGAKDRMVSAVGWRPWHRKARPIKGSPIVWKELHRPWFTHGWRSFAYGSIAVVVIVGAIVALALTGTKLYFVSLLLIQVLQLILVVRVAVSAASSVTREKEARTWPILLTTPLEDRDIVKGKAFGVLRRNLLLLVPLPLLYLLLTFTMPRGGTGPALLAFSLGGVVMGLMGAVVSLLGLGLYMSVRLKTTTAAVAATLGIYFGLKLFCYGAFSALFMGLGAAARTSGMMIFLPALITIARAVVYVGIGWLFLRLAMRRLRRDVFA
jgi:ABC-type transport system involved in multi-copper enzyme maturation permease subunit